MGYACALWALEQLPYPGGGVYRATFEPATGQATVVLSLGCESTAHIRAPEKVIGEYPFKRRVISKVNLSVHTSRQTHRCWLNVIERGRSRYARWRSKARISRRYRRNNVHRSRLSSPTALALSEKIQRPVEKTTETVAPVRSDSALWMVLPGSGSCQTRLRTCGTTA